MESPRIVRWTSVILTGIILLTFGAAQIIPTFPLTTMPLSTQASKTKSTGYIVIAWNDLGMHCMNPSFKDMCILPPFNTLYAQVVKLGDPPQIVTEGIKVKYSVPGNTYSAAKSPFPAKTDFWEYDEALFGVNLPDNVGLAGKGLAGDMDLTGNHFVAVGIPLTEYTDIEAKKMDTSARVPNHFQQALVIVYDLNGNELARSTPVIPISTELNCITCHADNGDATMRYPIQPTGNVDQNILSLHDYLNADTFTQLGLKPLMDNRPVLCADCHSDNALGKTGIEGVKSLSNAMHGHHNPTNAPDITPDTAGCYSCHPGPQTQCLRDTMSQNYMLQCTDCHGTIDNVATNTDPWVNEPTCGSTNCHGASFEPSQLYKLSMGHGSLYCEACHDSTHAIAPSRVIADDAKFIALQGEAGTLRKCSVCHSSPDLAAFTHMPKK